MSKIKVKVHPKIVKDGSGFHDFHSKTDIYPKKADEVFEVEKTPFINRKLDTGELILVESKKEKPKPEEDPKKTK